MTIHQPIEGETMTKPDYVMQTYISCTLDALWEALTNPEIMAQYHFMASRIWKDGDVNHYEVGDGVPLMDMRDIRLDPKTRIEQTFEPHWEGGGAPSRVVYLLREEGRVCSLTLEHYDLTFPVVEGEGVADGWARQLAGLKTFLELGTAVRFGTEATA